MPRRLVIILGILLLLGLCIAWIISSIVFGNNGKNHIVLTKTGFSPSVLQIKEGETVVFSTDQSESFWPASNIHPDHTLYPEFDPKKPIASSDTWSFTFSKAGRYSFHDHIFANFTGKIIVTGVGQSIDFVSDIHACVSVTDLSQKQQCWDEQLKQELETQGIDAAFKYFVELYNTEPEVPKNCHGWGHILGKAGYELYSKGEDPGLRPEASYCGYGFFHGFIAELIRQTGDITETKSFCRYVVEKLGTALPSIHDNCIHGVGHGATSMLIEEPENYGQIEKVMNEGIDICEKLFSDSSDLENCYDGVFNESQQVLLQSQYGLNFEEFKKLDLFLYCQRQPDVYKKSCYFEFIGIAAAVFGDDVVTIMDYALKNIQNLDVSGAKLVSKISADHIQTTIVSNDHSDSIVACDLVPEHLYESCFGGILNGFIQHGNPLNLHEKGYAFCGENGLTQMQQSNCREKYTEHLENVYTLEQMKKSCEYIQAIQKIPTCDKY